MSSKIIAHIVAWFPERNYGFLHEFRDGVVIKHFLHVANIYSGTPLKGSLVRFESEARTKGLVALNAEIFTNRKEMNQADAAAALVQSATASVEVRS